MLYPIERATPEQGIEKISREELQRIADKVASLNIVAEVFA
jgi:hypothetical protein